MKRPREGAGSASSGQGAAAPTALRDRRHHRREGPVAHRNPPSEFHSASYHVLTARGSSRHWRWGRRRLTEWALPECPLHHFVLNRHDVTDGFNPVGGIVNPGHLHVVERDVLVEQELGERLRSIRQSIFRAAIEVDVREILFRHLENQLEWIVRVGIFGFGERLAFRRAFLLAVEPRDTNERIWTAPRLFGCSLLLRGELPRRLRRLRRSLTTKPGCCLPRVLERAARAGDRNEQVRLG